VDESSREGADAAASLRLSRSYRRALLNAWLQKRQNRVQGVVLDVGGEKGSLVSYAFPAAEDVRRGMYLNISSAKVPNILGDGAHMHLAAQSTDTVISMETMEHVEDPRQVMGEFSRILRPAGVLVLNMPLLYRIHSRPDDFWRFTEYGVQRPVREPDLEIVQMERLGLFFTVLCDMPKQAISEIRFAALHWCLGLLLLPLATILVQLERIGLGRNCPAFSSFTTGYVVLATRAGQS